jgi:hypothetical protein
MADAPASFELAAADDAGFLRVTARGEFKLERIFQMIEYMVAESARRGLSRILVDVSALIGAPTAMDQFDIGEATAARLGPKRIAVLVRSAELISDHFGDHVAASFGGDVRSFTVESEAVAWLLGG